jgi:hexosaminidase
MVAAWLAVSVHASPAAHLPSLMPMPASVRWQAGRVAVDASLTVGVKGVADGRLRAAVDRMLVRLQGRTGEVLARGTLVEPDVATLRIDCDAPGAAWPSLEDDESYSLRTTARQVVLHAPTVVGAMHGLETFLQLLSGDRGGFFVPGVTIDDRPRFRWRGLLIDVGRHFEPVAVIERELDGMAAVKLNVLHWHLSDDQGFRVESRKYPKLHQLGSDGEYYTQDELREVVAYARDRGIRVVPEFDMPGHVTSWLVGYPELASAPGPFEVARTWGVFDGSFDPTRDGTYKFIDRFIGEMAPIFPDPSWHIGGDENNGKAWRANPDIQAFMEKKHIADVHALQTYFNQRLATILQKHHKRMMGWDEILQPGLPAEAVVQSWRGQKSLFDAARQGYDGVLSAGYYIDLLNTAASHYAVDPLPADSGLTEVEAAHVLGGEATMWGEWVGPETIDSRIWPRTAAIAERFWSPRDVADIDDMYRRLSTVSPQLEDLGLTHLRNRDVLLRRLAGSLEIGPLRTLAAVIEPVKGYRRGGQQPWMTSRGPLTHLVDAVSTDSLEARDVTRLVGTLLDDAPTFADGRNRLLAMFVGWRDLRPAFAILADGAPALAEAVPLANNLAEVGIRGIEALEYLRAGVAPDDGWRTSALAALDEAAKPRAALELPFLAAMRELVVAAVDQPALATMSRAEWRQHVSALAAPPRRGRGGR